MFRCRTGPAFPGSQKEKSLTWSHDMTITNQESSSFDLKMVLGHRLSRGQVRVLRFGCQVGPAFSGSHGRGDVADQESSSFDLEMGVETPALQGSDVGCWDVDVKPQLLGHRKEKPDSVS